MKPKPPVPKWRWATWYTALGAALVLFYGLFTPFWFGLPREVSESLHPFDDYVRTMSLVDAPTPEDDLFAGVREHVGAPGRMEP